MTLRDPSGLPILMIFLAHLIATAIGISQTYIEPTIGYNFSKNTGHSNEAWPLNDIITDEKIGNEKLLFGIGIIQSISERINIGL